MTLTIELTPEEERRLQAAARLRGESVEEWARRLLVDHLPLMTPAALEEDPLDEVELRRRLEAQGFNVASVTRAAPTPQERAAAYIAWAESHRQGSPVLSDEAISRDNIYEECRCKCEIGSIVS